MAERLDNSAEAVAHRPHDHGHDRSQSRTEPQQNTASEAGHTSLDQGFGESEVVLGNMPFDRAAGDGEKADGGTALQRSHARMLSEAGLGRSVNAQRRIDMYLQLQRAYGNSHVRQVSRLVQRQLPGGAATQEPSEADTDRTWEVRPQGTTGQGKSVQRVPIRAGDYSEDLLVDAPTTAPTAPPGTTPPAPPPPAYVTKNYTGTAAYNMTRQADGVHINVRILFLSPPTDQDASGNILPDNDPRRSGSEIPAGDARRTEATTLCQGGGAGGAASIASHWNGKAELVGKTKAAPGAGAGSHAPPDAAATGPDIVLPLKFEATPVFTASDDHDQQVFMHTATDVADPSVADPSRNLRPATPPPPGTAAPTPRMSVIDAGNWYTARPRGRYGFKGAGDPNNFPLDKIYAHEYGHYLGIPDEYSRSNPAMHTIMHGVTPNQADRDKMDQQINAASTEEIIIAAIVPQLKTHFNAISQAVLDAIQNQKKIIVKKLTEALRQGWRNKTVLDNILKEVNTRLDAQAAVPASGSTLATPAQPAQSKAMRASKEAVIFEATRNLSYLTKAQDAVNALISSGSAHSWINGIMSDALETSVGKATNNHVHQIGAGVPQLPAGGIGMSFETQGVPGTSANLDNAAANASRTLVGAAPPGTTPPAVHPSGSLLAQIAALPQAWKSMANMFDGAATIQFIETNAAANLDTGNFRGNVNDNVRKLYKQLYDRFNAVSMRASFDTLAKFISEQVQPLMEGQLRELITAIKAETSAHGTATPTGTSAAPAVPDPALAARAQAIKNATQTMAAEAKTIQDTPETTTAADGTVTKNRLHLSITANTVMGSQYAGMDVRPNYMENIAKSFNAARSPAVLKHEDETDFVVRRTGGGGSAAGAGP